MALAYGLAPCVGPPDVPRTRKPICSNFANEDHGRLPEPIRRIPTRSNFANEDHGRLPEPIQRIPTHSNFANKGHGRLPELSDIKSKKEDQLPLPGKVSKGSTLEVCRPRVGMLPDLFVSQKFMDEHGLVKLDVGGDGSCLIHSFIALLWSQDMSFMYKPDFDPTEYNDPGNQLLKALLKLTRAEAEAEMRNYWSEYAGNTDFRRYVVGEIRKDLMAYTQQNAALYEIVRVGMPDKINYVEHPEKLLNYKFWLEYAHILQLMKLLGVDHLVLYIGSSNDITYMKVPSSWPPLKGSPCNLDGLKVYDPKQTFYLYYTDNVHYEPLVPRGSILTRDPKYVWDHSEVPDHSVLWDHSEVPDHSVRRGATVGIARRIFPMPEINDIGMISNAEEFPPCTTAAVLTTEEITRLDDKNKQRQRGMDLTQIVIDIVLSQYISYSSSTAAKTMLNHAIDGRDGVTVDQAVKFIESIVKSRGSEYWKSTKIKMIMTLSDYVFNNRKARIVFNSTEDTLEGYINKHYKNWADSWRKTFLEKRFIGDSRLKDMSDVLNDMSVFEIWRFYIEKAGGADFDFGDVDYTLFWLLCTMFGIKKIRINALDCTQRLAFTITTPKRLKPIKASDTSLPDIFWGLNPPYENVEVEKLGQQFYLLFEEVKHDTPTEIQELKSEADFISILLGLRSPSNKEGGGDEDKDGGEKEGVVSKEDDAAAEEGGCQTPDEMDKAADGAPEQGGKNGGVLLTPIEAADKKTGANWDKNGNLNILSPLKTRVPHFGIEKHDSAHSGSSQFLSAWCTKIADDVEEAVMRKAFGDHLGKFGKEYVTAHSGSVLDSFKHTEETCLYIRAIGESSPSPKQKIANLNIFTPKVPNDNQQDIIKLTRKALGILFAKCILQIQSIPDHENKNFFIRAPVFLFSNVDPKDFDHKAYMTMYLKEIEDSALHDASKKLQVYIEMNSKHDVETVTSVIKPVSFQLNREEWVRHWHVKEFNRALVQNENGQVSWDAVKSLWRYPIGEAIRTIKEQVKMHEAESDVCDFLENAIIGKPRLTSRSTVKFI